MLRIKAIFFLTLFSFSAFGSTFEIHYCKGVIKDITFFGATDATCDTKGKIEEKSCSSEHSCCIKPELELESNESLDQNTCCKTEVAQLNTTVHFQQLSQSLQLVWLPISVFNCTAFVPRSINSDTSLDYINPEYWEDIPIKIQCLLI